MMDQCIELIGSQATGLHTKSHEAPKKASLQTEAFAEVHSTPKLVLELLFRSVAVE